MNKKSIELTGMSIALLATGLEIFFVNRLRETQANAEIYELEHKIRHIYNAVTSGDPKNYATGTTRGNFDILDFIGTDLWYTEVFSIALGVFFIIGGFLMIVARAMPEAKD